MNFFKLLIFLITTRIFLLFSPWFFTILLYPEKPITPILNFIENAWIWWDARIYLLIAQNGYTSAGDPSNFIVFFPLYPVLIHPLILLFGKPVLIGVIVSSIFFILSALLFYNLLKTVFSEIIAKYSIIVLVIFPTAYFLNAPYSESLFLLLWVISFYGAHKKNWILAGFAAGLATFTRPFGFLIALSILIDWILAKRRAFTYLPFIILPSLVATLAYLNINQFVYGDALTFQKILAEHWQKYPTFPLNGIFDTWKRALFGELNNYTLMIGWAEAISITTAWLILPFAWLKLPRLWAIYYALAILMFSSTSFILSTPRYFLSVPPLFALIGMAMRNSLFKNSWLFISTSLLIYLTFLFVNGQWAF